MGMMLALTTLPIVLVPQAALTRPPLLAPAAAARQRADAASLLLGRGPPPEIAAQLAPDPNDPNRWTTKDVNQLWAAFEDVYGSRERALGAARRNVKVLLPFINTPARIRESYAVLVDMFGKEEAAELITKNPGVLSCEPVSLSKTPPNDIRSAARLVSFVDDLPPGVIQYFDPLKSVLFPILIALTVFRVTVQCADGACAESANAWDLQGGFGPQAVRYLQSLLSF